MIFFKNLTDRRDVAHDVGKLKMVEPSKIIGHAVVLELQFTPNLYSQIIFLICKVALFV